MSEEQRKEFLWVSVTPFTLVGLRKSLLPAHGLCPPWELRTGGHSGVTLGPSQGPGCLGSWPPLFPSLPLPHCVPLSTCSPGESLAKWGIKPVRSQFGAQSSFLSGGPRGEGRDPCWETRGLPLSPQSSAKALYLSGPQFPHL